MSTNHRPQLESKRGKVIRIKDSIKHARGLPQQTSIKYRQDIKNDKTTTEFNDSHKHESINPPTKKLKIEPKKEITDKPSNQEVDEIEILSKNHDESEISANEKLESEEESDEDSEEDSDDDTALLLKEIENIRREKEKQDSTTNNSIALHNNETTLKKKSWRLSTTFNNKSKKQSINNKTYTTDTLNSEHHQKFMSKYIR